MTAQLTDLERRLAEIAVAGAPPFTEEQIAEFRRVLKPYATPLVRMAPAVKARVRRAA